VDNVEVTDNNNGASDITEEDVAQYLQDHAEFFLNRDELLLELKLAHPSGEAVSLLERQVSLLRERNMELNHRLGGLLEHAEDNDQLYDKTQQLVLALIEAQDLDTIVNTFNRSLLTDFGIDFSNLILFGNPEQYRDVLSVMVPVDDAFAAIPSLLKNNKATCGVLRPEDLQFLFTDQAQQVGSAAVMPLGDNNPLGVIAIGSKDPNRFSSTMGTLFLSYIADVLSRLIPRYQ